MTAPSRRVAARPVTPRPAGLPSSPPVEEEPPDVPEEAAEPGAAPGPEPQIMQTIVKETTIVQQPDTPLLLACLAKMAQDALALLQLPKETFHCVLVPDTGEASLQSFTSVKDLADCLRDITRRSIKSGQNVQAFPFCGQALAITTPPRYLLAPDGKYPLFAGDVDEAVDQRGFLGPPQAELRTAAPDEPAEDLHEAAS